MPDQTAGLELPADLAHDHRRVLEDMAERNAVAHGDDLLGMILSGSAGRGIATAHSDVDVYVVLTDDGLGRCSTTHPAEVDEIPVALSELEQLPTFGTEGWFHRWSFAWVPVLLDRTGGRVAVAAQRQASVSPEEATEVLLKHDRLDGWLNYAYRALKNDRDGRDLERRLDAAESMPWLLDVVFSLAGRVRPYHKYLPWELRQHPLPDWDADELLTLLIATLDGDPAAIRATFARIEPLARAFDALQPEPVLTPVIADWGTELDLLRG